MNYTKDGTAVIDAQGKEWPVNTWHAAGPLNGTPPGIEPLDHYGNYSGEVAYKATDENRSGFWLVRPPLPELPREKTQEEIDYAELHKAWNRWAATHEHPSSFSDGWHAGVAYERARKPADSSLSGFCKEAEKVLQEMAGHYYSDQDAARCREMANEALKLLP